MKAALGNAKMTYEDVRGMKERIFTGQSSVQQEAMRFQVARETIRRALRGETFVRLVVEDELPDKRTHQFDEVLKDAAAASLNRVIEEGLKKRKIDPVAEKRMREMGMLPPELVAPPLDEEEEDGRPPTNPLEEE